MESKQELSRQIEQAIEAVQAQPSSVRPKQKLAELYLRAGEPEKSVQVYTSLAEDQIARDQLAAGAAIYKKMLQTLPASFCLAVHRRLGELYTTLERHQEAHQQWLRYAELIAPDTALDGSDTARLPEPDALDDAAKHKAQEALLALEQAETLAPVPLPDQIRLAELYALLGRLSSAVETYEQILESLEERMYWSDYTKAAQRLLVLAPSHLPARKMLARLALEKGDVMEAVRQLQHAFRIQRRDPETLEMLSMAFDFLGQEKKSLSVLKELADVYEEQSELVRARQLYRKILERDPQNQTALNALSHLQVLAGLRQAESTELVAEEARPSTVAEDTSRSAAGASAGGATEPPGLGAGVALSSEPAASLESDGSGAETASVEAASREATGEPPGSPAAPSPFEGMRDELKHCDVPSHLLTDEVFYDIFRRKPHPGRQPGRWPSHLRRRLDGELLYEGRYLVTDFLGKGIFGKTYRAIDLADRTRFVCIKRPHFFDLDEEYEADFNALFLAHAQGLIERSHPHLVRVLAAGITELGYPYLVTEYFDGLPLTEQELSLSSAAICEMVYRLVHTLSYLQSIGSIHGNLNPKNVMLNERGQVYLSDAGLWSLSTTLQQSDAIASLGGSGAFPAVASGEFSSVAMGSQVLIGTRGFLAPELLQGEEPTIRSEIFSLGCLLYYMVMGAVPPWGQGGVIDASQVGLSRSSTDPTPELELDQSPHSDFLRSLFSDLIAVSPEERPSLRDIQRQYMHFATEGLRDARLSATLADQAEEVTASLRHGHTPQPDEEGATEALPGSFEVGHTAKLTRSPMFRVSPTPSAPRGVPADASQASSDELVAGEGAPPTTPGLPLDGATDEIEPELPSAKIEEALPPDLSGREEAVVGGAEESVGFSVAPTQVDGSSGSFALLPELRDAAATQQARVEDTSPTVAHKDPTDDDMGDEDADDVDGSDDSHPRWSDAPPLLSTASSLPPLVAPPTPHATVVRDTASRELVNDAAIPELGLLQLPEDEAQRYMLPAACTSLPVDTQDALARLLQRMKKIDLFSGRGDPDIGIEYLHEHVQRLQAFSDFPLAERLAYVRTSWNALQEHLATQQEVDKIAQGAASRILDEDPTALARAGQIAWAAIDQFTFSQSRLLPFKLAINAVSAIGWSPEEASEWSAATTAAKAAVKREAKIQGRNDAWNAAKSLAWCTVWPLAKAAAVRAFHPLAHAVAWPVSWDASWHMAWASLRDIQGFPSDPFEPMFAVWEMGLYPLQLHDGQILLIVLDANASDDFHIEHVK